MREQVRNLINMGKQRGYLLAEEVEQVLPAELHSTEEIDDLLSTFERLGINIFEDLAAAKALLRDGAITVEQVAKRLGVAPSTLYRHLPGGRSTIEGRQV